MKLSYYPGCSLLGTAAEFNESTRAVLEALDIQLQEIDDWNCCGASSAHNTSEFLSVALPARCLIAAEKAGMDLVVPCAACFNRLCAAHNKLLENPDLNRSIAEILGSPYGGNLEIKHLLQVLYNGAFERLKERAQKPLTGLRTVCYYGCLTVRPPDVTGIADFENPRAMDHIMDAIGAENRFWSYKTDCCGGALALARTDVVSKLVGTLIDMAREAGAECIVTACPMCQANLDTRQSELGIDADGGIPIFFVTELIALAIGRDEPGWWRKHLIDPQNLLKSKGLI